MKRALAYPIAVLAFLAWVILLSASFVVWLLVGDDV